MLKTEFDHVERRLPLSLAQLFESDISYQTIKRKPFRLMQSGSVLLLGIFRIVRITLFAFYFSTQAFAQPSGTGASQLKTGRDGAEMVLIPAGEFEMGTDPAEIRWTVQWLKKLYPELLKNIDTNSFSFKDETPRHTVYVDAFYMDRYEVTNEQYRKFAQATGRSDPQGVAFIKLADGKFAITNAFKPWSDTNFNGVKQPVICVSYDDARAYAEWAGKRLPTEAQWEKAARGKLVGKHFAWGDSWPPDRNAGNFADEDFRAATRDASFPFISGHHDGYAYTAGIGSFVPNAFGLHDMTGNVSEWCEDWYADDYYSRSPKSNPAGPPSGENHVTRGGSWFYKWAFALRVGDREDVGRSTRAFDIGFRCVTPAR
jgi:formylglycine-generating enzyme